MVSGLNRRCKIVRVDWASDDSVGGAVVTGPTAYWNVPLRMQENSPEQLLLQQGLETQKTFTGIVIPGTMIIYERDELEITAPRDDIYYGKRFRIVSVRHSDLNPRDPRNYVMLDLVRSVRAHTQQ